MYEILERKALNDNVVRLDVKAPFIAAKAKAGQFVILMPKEDSERIPLTIAGTDKEKGTVTVIFQTVGETTMELASLKVGDSLFAFSGPLGKPTALEKDKKYLIIGGGVGSAIAYPIAKSLSEMGNKATVICGFRNKDIVILEDEFKEASGDFYLATDDGSYGIKGNVVAVMEEVLKDHKIDEVITIGPLIMMKFVTECAKKHNLKVTVSMNPIMIDGTGMCGCCRLMVGGQMKFACIDGPDFDGTLINFDEAMSRNRSYLEFEKKHRETACNLFKKEAN